MNQDDRRLILECLGGQTEAFGELVRRYQDRLFHAVLRIVDNPDDALDAVQDAFINAYVSLASFKGDAEFYTWLYRIAFNTAVSLKRRRRMLVSLDSGRDGETGIDPADPLASVKAQYKELCPTDEKFMEEFATPVESFDSPPLPVTHADIEKLLAVAPKYGIEILPPPH